MHIIIAVIIIHVYSYHCDYGEGVAMWQPVVNCFPLMISSIIL